MPATAAYWDPISVLNLNLDPYEFRCHGKTLKGEGCLCRINKDDRSSSSSLVASMSLQRPRSTAVSNLLAELAPLTLCKNHHRGGRNGQVENKISQWRAMIHSCFPVSQTATTPPAQQSRTNLLISPPRSVRAITYTTPSSTSLVVSPPARTARIPRPVSPPTTPSSTTHRAPESPATPLPARPSVDDLIQDFLSLREQELAILQELISRRSPATATPISPSFTNLASSNRATPPSSRSTSSVSRGRNALSPLSTSSASSGRATPSSPGGISSTSSGRATPSSPGDISYTSSGRATPSSPLSTSSTSSNRAPSFAPQNPQTRTVRRRLITEPCSICFYDIEHRRDAVWCREQCGQNFHTDCVTDWHNQLPVGIFLTCPWCRAPWHEQ